MLEMVDHSKKAEDFAVKPPFIPNLDTTKEDERNAGVVALALGLVTGVLYVVTSVETFLILFLVTVLFYLGVWVFYLHHWVYPRADIEKSLIYKIATKTDEEEIDEERKEEIREDWHYYRRGYSQYGEFVDLKLENRDLTSPLTDSRQKELYEKRYSEKTAFDIGKDITKERLEGDENLYLHFVNYYYEEFTRQARQREEAGVGTKTDEGLVEQERRELKRHYAGQRVEREAVRERLKDIARTAKGIERAYQEALDEVEEMDLPAEAKERAKKEIEKEYERLKEKEVVQEEEETDRWGGGGN